MTRRSVERRGRRVRQVGRGLGTIDSRVVSAFERVRMIVERNPTESNVKDLEDDFITYLIPLQRQYIRALSYIPEQLYDNVMKTLILLIRYARDADSRSLYTDLMVGIQQYTPPPRYDTLPPPYIEE